MKRILLVWSMLSAALAGGALIFLLTAGPEPAPHLAAPLLPPAVPALPVAHTEPEAAAGAPDAESQGEDFRADAEAALHIADPEVRRRALSAVLRRWLAADPQDLLNFVMAVEVENDHTKLDNLASALRAALAADATLAEAEAAQEAIRRLTSYLAAFDPDAAQELAARLDDNRREAVAVSIARGLALRDPAEGLALARQLDSPLRRMQAFAAVGGVWAENDPPAALAWAAALPPTASAMALNAILATMAPRDTAAAAAQLASVERAMADAYEARYRADLDAMGLNEIDLANAEETYLEMLENGEVPPPTSSDVELLGDAARVVAGKLAEQGPTAAVAWAEGLENDRLRIDAVKGALSGWSERDPEAAAAYAAARYAGMPEMVTAVFDVWGGAAGAEAAAAAAAVQDAEVRAVATAAVAEAWAASDPTAAAAWLDGLPAGERTDAVRLEIVAGLSAVDPVDAWQRAQAIGDPRLQYRALKMAFSNLVVQQPEIAGELLASARLSEHTTERLQDVLTAAGAG